MIDTRQPDERTVQWYVEWLTVRFSDWTEEQRLEIATEFARQQLPPQCAVEPEEDETVADVDPPRKHLNKKELQAILAPPPQVKK